MDFSKEVNEIIVAIAAINSTLPKSVSGMGVEKNVAISIKIVGKEIRQLTYEIRGKWEAEYEVEKLIKQTIIAKAALLGIPVITHPE